MAPAGYDGDVDILIGADVNDYTGSNPDYGGVALVLANTAGEFALTAALPASESGGTMTWADLNADGDLDFLTTGARFEGFDTGWVYFAWLYRNDAPESNAAPSPPALTPTSDGVTLAWGAAADDHTPPDALTDNVWVSTRNGSDSK